MIKRIFSRFNLFFLFSFFIVINLLIAFIIINVLLMMGLLEISICKDPVFAIDFLLLISFVIGSFMPIVSSRIILKPIRHMLYSTKRLAGGDFSVRIDSARLFSKELRDFSDEFNAMAKELGRIEMLRSDFVNNFSHEFKTPIVSIRGFAKLLKEDNLSPQEREDYLDIIISESERLSDMATNVLNLTKIENQTIITEKSTFDLSEHIRRAVLILESKWAEKNLELEINVEEISYYGNPDLLSQVWINVLDNAIKFSLKNGKLEISLLDHFDSIAFSVKDYGYGMDHDTQEQIFNKFYQQDRSGMTDGNGLGMAIVKNIVSLHAGQISVESKLGQSTCVTVVLPKQADNKTGRHSN